MSMLHIVRWPLAIALLLVALLFMPADASAHGPSTPKKTEALQLDCISGCGAEVSVAKLPDQDGGCAGEQKESCGGLLWCSGAAVNPSLADQLPHIATSDPGFFGIGTLPSAELLLGLFRPPRA